jgi:hypothetical protein
VTLGIDDAQTKPPGAVEPEGYLDGSIVKGQFGPPQDNGVVVFRPLGADEHAVLELPIGLVRLLGLIPEDDASFRV